jgi:hypothetical protein
MVDEPDKVWFGSLTVDEGKLTPTARPLKSLEAVSETNVRKWKN